MSQFDTSPASAASTASMPVSSVTSVTSPSPSQPIPSNPPPPPAAAAAASKSARPIRWSSEPTLKLTLTSSYAPHWSKREGVRELVQNWIDGLTLNLQQLNSSAARNAASPSSVSSAYSLSIHFHSPSAAAIIYTATAHRPSHPPVTLGHLHHHAASSSLVLLNRNVSLTRKILLIGYSSKRGEKEMVGSFGEGLKVGLLALLRDGCRVLMQTRGELWRFGFYDDAGYGERLLGVYTREEEEGEEEAGQQQQPGQQEERKEAEDEAEEAKLVRLVFNANNKADTTTVVAGITAADWESFRTDFLFLSPPAAASVVTVEGGAILLSDSHHHRLYVKGFLIAAYPPHELRYGVDIKDVQLDRDRKAVLRMADLHQRVGSMWVQAVTLRPDLLPAYFDLLAHHSTAAESRNAEYYLTSQLIESVASTFFSLHGHDSQPVQNDNADDAVFISAQLQRRPVLVPAALYDILTRSSRIETVESLMTQHAASAVPSTPLSSLSPQHLHVLQSALRLLQLVAPLLTAEDVAVTAFADDGVWAKEEEGGAGRVLLDSRCFDLEAVHSKWGDCGAEDRRLAEGKGKGLQGWVGMTDCSCREVAIAGLLVKESPKVRWRRTAAAARAGATAAEASGRGGRGGGRLVRGGGDAIMDHIARSRESELVLMQLMERVVRRGERERQRRQQLEEDKQALLQTRRQTAQQLTAAELKQPEQEELKQEEVDAAPARSPSPSPSSLQLQHELELARAEVVQWQQRAEREAKEGKERERLLRLRVDQLSGQSLAAADEALLSEYELLHLEALRELQRLREQRRQRAREEEDERRKRRECSACMERAVDSLLLPCRHLCVCHQCGLKLDKCPLCRMRIADRIQCFSQ